MSDFLTSLAARALLPSGDVQPRLLSLFESEREGEEPLHEDGTPSPGPDMEELNSEINPSHDSKRGLPAARIAEVRANVPPAINSLAQFSQPHPVNAAGRDVPREVVVEPEIRRDIEEGRDERDESPHIALAEQRAKPEERNEFSRIAPTPAVKTAAATPHTPAAISSHAPPPPAVVPAQLPPSPVAVREHRESSRHLSERDREPEPRVIQISIGRIEIRAATSAPTSPRNPARQDARAMTLDEYLRDKAAGGSR